MELDSILKINLYYSGDCSSPNDNVEVSVTQLELSVSVEANNAIKKERYLLLRWKNC